MRLSAENLSQPISDDQPCGEDLEYDNAFQAIETALQSQGEGVMEDQQSGDEELDWPAVGKHAEDLLGRTRDMRVFVYAAMAGLNTDGLPMFHEALIALNNCMEAYWDEIHPQLDPDDDNDPMLRMNVLQNLDDRERVHQGIRRSPLVELKGVGRFSLHDIDLATGNQEAAEDEESVDIAIIEGAFMDGDREHLAAISDAVEGSLAELSRLSEIWSEKTDGYEQPGVEGTIGDLRAVGRALAEYAPAGTVAGGEGDADGADDKAAAGVGAINSNADVIRALDRICEYYAKNEPSSPIPPLLKRAQRLVSKSFYEILRDLVPDGVSQFNNISGQKPED